MTETQAKPATTAHDDEMGFSVGGMNCASCVAHVTKAARKVPGVHDVNVNFARGRAIVKFDPAQASPETIATAITDSGYPTAPEHGHHANAEEQRVAHHAAHARSWARRALVGVALWLPVELTHWILWLTRGGDYAHHGVNGMMWVALAS